MRIYLKIVSCLFYLQIVFVNKTMAQQNDVSVDSLKKMLCGKWLATGGVCGAIDNDSLEHKMNFDKNKFYLTETFKDSVINKLSGIYRIDSVNTAGYNMFVTIDEEFCHSKLNTLLLNIQLFGNDKVLVSYYEMVYRNNEQRYIYYRGNFRLFKED